MLKFGFAGTLVLAATLLGVFVTAAAPEQPQDAAAERRKATRLHADGNVGEAYAIFRTLALGPGEGKAPRGDLDVALQCLARLGRYDEQDALVEAVVAAHPDNPHVLSKAAEAYSQARHYGSLIAGEFHRGSRRDRGEFVASNDRDRVRAIQLLRKAIEQAPVDGKERAQLHLEMAEVLLMGREGDSAWQLQTPTNLDNLPAYGSSPFGGRWSEGGTSRAGAPVDDEGHPVVYSVPQSFDAAASDGERWRWALEQAKQADSQRAADADLHLAAFLHSQFGVGTLRSWSGWRRLAASDDGKPTDPGPYALHTLSDDETIAKLATGVKRFPLPEEFNYLRLYKGVARGEGEQAATALKTLASIYEDRRQFPKAAAIWKEAIERFGPGEENERQNRLQQITGNWLEFENVRTQVAGKPAAVTLRFRNGKQVDFTAKLVKFEQLIADAQAYLQASRNQPTIDRKNIEIEDIGHRLVRENETKYLGETVATWQETLDPPADHFDARVSLETPLSKAGVYLLTAKMADGNESRIIVWLTDTAIVRKSVGDEFLYFVADAATGAPVSNAVVEFFGWDLERDAGRRFITTSRFGETTDANGLVIPSQRALDERYQWLVVAKTKEGRFAHLGFDGVWYDDREGEDDRLIKAYLITDRPVYRPDQSVKYKVWVRQADFARDWGAEMFASKPLTVEIVNPRGETVLNQKVVSDENGSVEGSYDLPTGAMLGTYAVRIKSGNAYYSGGGSFRVEEYKKPEFEVTVDAPSEPVMLGKPITATITANYYFGSPVTNAQVHYKVTRTKHEDRWYPIGRWDWLYGRGYWWFAAASEWYPGFARWGCFPPLPPWHYGPSEPPEVVAEATVPIGEDGVVDVNIDTAIAKELFGDSDHRYEITAEVTDASRRTITGSGSVFAPREPFQVTAWVDRGFYQAGDAVTATFQAQTIAGKPVSGDANVTLYRVTYDDKGKPSEKAVETWKLETGDDGDVEQKFTATEPGQYRIACTVTDDAGHAIEGGYLLNVLPDRTEQAEHAEYRYNALELTADQREYRPGETAKLHVAANRSDATVLLFVRSENGSAPRPQVLKLAGRSQIVEVAIEQRDMPNIFVEALTISDGKTHTVVRELFVPPAERVVNVEVLPSKEEFKPGETASVEVKLTGEDGKPIEGEVALTMYDRSVEYISGGSNVPEIREFFWKWRRDHHPQTLDNLGRVFGHLSKRNETGMRNIGAFGHLVGLNDEFMTTTSRAMGMGGMGGGAFFGEAEAAPAAPAFAADAAATRAVPILNKVPYAPPDGSAPLVEATIRSDFADTALWEPGRVADENGIVELSLTMPENLTAWKIRAWAMGEGTKVGEASAEVVTKKNLLVRMQAPRFFTETDEVVLSANVHNYLDSDKQAQVSLELEGETLAFLDEPVRTVTVPAGGEVRVDWRVKAANTGEAIVTMKALTDEESDAMRQTFPVNIHGILRTESYTGTVRPEESEATVTFTIPEQRRINDSLIEVRFSPSLAAAMVDALPYLADYPYGCTEQTLNRFVPTVITQNALKQMGISLADIRDQRTNLNPQEIGERGTSAPRVRDDNPVFDETEVQKMADEGLARLVETQSPDGGWGWFPGGQSSSAHMTALVVHGLMTGKEAGLNVPDGVIERGVEWLKGHQQREIAKLKNAPSKTEPFKTHASNLDAFVALVLTESGAPNAEMNEFLYRDRQQLSLYSLAMVGLVLEQVGSQDRLDMVLRNLSQFVVEDDENGTAYLRLPNEGYWWVWYGSEIEANAYYLKLLSKTDPKGELAPKLVKYLLNNRKNATYWNSTRDTAIAIEAMADYLAASGEAQPNMIVEVLYDGQMQHEATITAENLFSFDNAVTIVGDAVEAGEHSITLRKKGNGPLYWNTYVTVFTQEDSIKSAGLEVKVDRKVYKLTRKEDATATRRGSQGQSVAGAVETYDRTVLKNGDSLASGDLVEVELVIDSKNDYEYLAFEDMKAAGFEPVEVQSGYTGNSLGAYMELRDEKVAFFVERLPRGKHSVKYRLRAEIPGNFSALPAKGYAMYAPELRGNSDELKLEITDE